MKNTSRDLLAFASENRRYVIWTTLLFTVVALGFAILRPTRWSASQALFVRDEGSLAVSRGGRFESTDAMQTAQETILEISQHPQVLEAALQEVGPPPRLFKRAWPTAHHVDDFRKKVRVTAPGGAQFGRTEMIYLSVENHDRQRAVELTDAVSEHLMKRMMQLRKERYDSLIAEMEEAVAIAQGELEVASRQLECMEKEAGIDIAELRVLVDQGQGDGNVRRAISEISTELRAARDYYNELRNQHEQLALALNNPSKLITMPNSFLNSQPTLVTLKEGLVNAQLRTSQTIAVKSARHPDVQAAIKSEQRIRGQLHQQLKIAVESLRSELDVAQQRVAGLTKQHDLMSGRMGGLAAVRTRYSNLVTEVQQRSQFLQTAEANLALARSNQISAKTVSLIQRVDKPVPGTRPLGISRRYIVLGGMVGGFLTGLGLLFIMLPEQGSQSVLNGSNRRLGFGRRGTDGFMATSGRRTTDRLAPGQQPPVPSTSANQPTAAKAPSQPAPSQPATSQPATSQPPVGQPTERQLCTSPTMASSTARPKTNSTAPGDRAAASRPSSTAKRSSNKAESAKQRPNLAQPTPATTQKPVKTTSKSAPPSTKAISPLMEGAGAEVSQLPLRK